MKGPQAYSKRVGAGGGWLKLLLISLALILSCRKSITPPPTPQYDPRNISRTETDSYSPAVEVGLDGTVYVAWMDGGHGEYEPSQIYFRYRESGEDWSEIEILSDSAHDAWAPKLACDPVGNLHLVWEDHCHGINVFYRIRTPDGEWSDVENISWPLTGWNEQPRIAVDSSGVVHVIWINGFSMKYRQKPPGGDWSSIEPVPVGSQGAVNPNMCADAEGGAHIVYEGNEEIYYLYRSPSGGWSEPVNVSESSWYSWYANVAVDSMGRPYVLWSDEDWASGVYTSSIYMSYLSDSGWVKGLCLEGARVGHSWPRTKWLYFANGKEYLLWGDGFFEIFLGFSYRGHIWEGIEVVRPFEPPGSPYPVGVLYENELYVVWSCQVDGNWEVFFDVVELK